MLESKYLTQDGMEYFLKNLHKQGYRYLFYDTSVKLYIASEQEPRFANTSDVCCCGDKKSAIVNPLEIAILQELLKPRLYIAIEDHVDWVDWSKVAVDTPIFVRSSIEEDWSRRHFAKYKDGKVCAWSYGKTSWSEETFSAWKYAKLAE